MDGSSGNQRALVSRRRRLKWRSAGVLKVVTVVGLAAALWAPGSTAAGPPSPLLAEDSAVGSGSAGFFAFDFSVTGGSSGANPRYNRGVLDVPALDPRWLSLNCQARACPDQRPD